jgi:hypothetical protein
MRTGGRTNTAMRFRRFKRIRVDQVPTAGPQRLHSFPKGNSMSAKRALTCIREESKLAPTATTAHQKARAPGITSAAPKGCYVQAHLRERGRRICRTIGVVGRLCCAEVTPSPREGLTSLFGMGTV